MDLHHDGQPVSRDLDPLNVHGAIQSPSALLSDFLRGSDGKAFRFKDLLVAIYLQQASFGDVHDSNDLVGLYKFVVADVRTVVLADAVSSAGIPLPSPCDHEHLAGAVGAIIAFLMGIAPQYFPDPLQQQYDHVLQHSAKLFEKIREWAAATPVQEQQQPMWNPDWLKPRFDFSCSEQFKQWDERRKEVNRSADNVKELYREARKLFMVYQNGYVERKSNMGITFKEDGWKYDMERKLVEVLNNFLYLMIGAEPDEDKGATMMMTNMLLLDQIREDLHWRRVLSAGGKFATLNRYSSSSVVLTNDMIKALERQKKEKSAGYGRGRGNPRGGGGRGDGRGRGRNFRGPSKYFGKGNRGGNEKGGESKHPPQGKGGAPQS